MRGETTSTLDPGPTKNGLPQECPRLPGPYCSPTVLVAPGVPGDRGRSSPLSPPPPRLDVRHQTRDLRHQVNKWMSNDSVPKEVGTMD